MLAAELQKPVRPCWGRGFRWNGFQKHLWRVLKEEQLWEVRVRADRMNAQTTRRGDENSDCLHRHAGSSSLRWV